MSRYSGDSYRWRRGSGGRNNEAAGHSGHHWPPGGSGSQGYPKHNYHLLPDPYMSFEQQPTWTPNSLMPWLQQESWSWQQIPQASGFVPGGTSFSKLPPKTHPEQQMNRQKQSKSLKHNKQQQNQQQQQQHQQKNQPQQQNNQQQQQQQKNQQQQQQKKQQHQKKQQQQQQQQQQKKQKQPQEQQQQQQQKLQQQQTKANVEKKAGGNQLQNTENQEKSNPPLGSEEARRKALESTTDKLKRCLSSMGQERTEVLETLLDEAAPAASVAKIVTQEGSHDESIGPMLPAAPPEPEIRLSPADWRRIALSSQKTPAAVEEDDVVFISAPPPEMVAIDDSSDDESHTKKAIDSAECKNEKQENMSAICKTEPEEDPTIAEDCEHNTNLEDNAINDLQREDQTNVLEMSMNSGAVDFHQEQGNSYNAFVNEDVFMSVNHVEPVKNTLHDKETYKNCKTTTVKEVRENVCDPEKAVPQSAFVQTENTEANVSAVSKPVDSAVPKAQSTTRMERPRRSSESCSTVSAHPRTRSASLQSPPAFPTTEPRVSGNAVDALKRNVMRKLLAMGAASVRDIVDNPTQSRRVQHALCHLVNEHRTAWTRHMRRLAEARFRRDCSSTVQSLEPTVPPDLEADADAAVDLASLPPELIERLGDLLQLDGLGASAEGMEPGISDDGLEELQELQEALCRQATIESVPEKDLSDLLPEMKQEVGPVKEELEEEIDRFDDSTGLDTMRVTDMTATEPNSSDPPVTEFGSLFCDFPDFSSDLDRASNCSLPMPLSDNLATDLQTSEHLQEPPIMTRDLQSDVAFTVAESGTNSAAKDSSKNTQTAQIAENDTKTQEAALNGEDFSVTLCNEPASITEIEPCDVMMSEQTAVPNSVMSVTSDSLMTKESDDMVSSMESQLSNSNNSVDRMCRIRTLAARKEYKTNESPVDTGTQTEDSMPVEPYSLLQLLQNKFSVPLDLIKTVRSYLTHSNRSGNSSCKSQQKTSDNVHTDSIVDYSGCELQQSVLDSFQIDDTASSKKPIDTEHSHLLLVQTEQRVLGESCNTSVDYNMDTAVHSDQTNAEPEKNTERQNDQVFPHTSSEDNSNILHSYNTVPQQSSHLSGKRQHFPKRKIQKRNPAPRNRKDFRFVSKSPPKKFKAHYNKSIHPYSSSFHSNVDANRNLDAVSNRSIPEENNSLTQTVLSHTREQVNTVACANNIAACLPQSRVNADLPVSMSNHIENLSTSNAVQSNTSVSGNIFKQMFEIDTEVTRLMQRKLELYKLLEGACVAPQPQLTNSLSATADNRVLKINTNCGAISKKAWKKRQRLIRRNLGELATSARAASNVISEDNTNAMPVLESAVMDVPNVQNVMGSQTIPILHREETVIMRPEQKSLKISTENSHNTVKGVETCEMHLDTPVVNKRDDNQLLTMTLPSLESSEVVGSENTVQPRPSVENEVNSFCSHAENPTPKSKEDTLDMSSCMENDVKITGTLNLLDAPNHQASLGTESENTVDTNEVDNEIVCEPIVPKRSRTTKSKRQKGHNSSQESLDEAATGIQNDNRLASTKEKSLSLEPIVKLVDISEVSIKIRRKASEDSELNQDIAQESIPKGKENNVCGVKQEMILLESDDSINKTVEEESLVISSCVNKRGRTKSTSASKSSNSKRLKSTVKADADVTGNGDLTDPHNVDSPEPKGSLHSSEQESGSSNTAVEINMLENAFSNYRSTRRKRPFGESVGQESSEESPVTNTDNITTITGSKRRRGRNLAAVLTSTSIKQEESDASESGGTKENRKLKGDHQSSHHSSCDGNVENTEYNSRFVSAVATTEVSEGNSCGDIEMCDTLQETRRKPSLAKSTSSTKKTEVHTKSRVRFTDSENRSQKANTEKNKLPAVKAERSNLDEFGTSIGDNEKCDDIFKERKRKLPLPKNVSSAKKTEARLKSRGKSRDLEVKLEKSDSEENSTPAITAERCNSVELGTSSNDDEKCDDLEEAKSKLPLPKNVSSTKKTEPRVKSRGRSTVSEVKLQKSNTEKKSNTTELGTSSDDDEKCDDLEEAKSKLPLPKNVSSTKKTELRVKSRGRSTDSEVKLQKSNTEKKSNTIELETSSGDDEKCDVLEGAKSKLPLPKNVSSTKKTEPRIKSRGKSTDSEVKRQKSNTEKNSNTVEHETSSDDEKCDVLEEAESKLPLPKNVSSTKKTEPRVKSRGKSTDSEVKRQKSNTEKQSTPAVKIERTGSVDLSFESDTDSLPRNSNQVARKRPVTSNRRKGRKKTVPDILVDFSQDGEKDTVESEISSPQIEVPDHMTAGRIAPDVSSADTMQKEKEEAADGERNQLPINSKSWRMRAVAQIRQCEVKLERLTEAEVRAATERPKLEASCILYDIASDESDVDSEPEVIFYPDPSPRAGSVVAPVVLDEEDPSSPISLADTASGGGTPAHEADTINDLRRMHLILVGHTGAILALVTVGRQAVAASEDGFVYCYSLKSGRLKRVVSCGSQPVTCLCVVEAERGQLIYAGSLDGHMRCFTFKSGTHIFEAVDVGAPIQCIDHNWGNVYMGNQDGTIAIFNTNTRELLEPRLPCTNEAILSLRATKEGPRQVLLVACRNQPLSIRDAKTGLLMRTVSLNMNGSVYCTLLDSSLIYCGTSNGKICVYEFTSGMEVYRLTAGLGVVVCLRLFRNLLFAGCFDGYIYIYNLQDKALLTRIPGPGKMIFCMEVVKNRVIASSKENNKLEAWGFPPEIRRYSRDLRHR